MTNPTIRHERMSAIFHKYHVDGLSKSVVIHKFTEPEPLDADAHDHPFDFTTYILSGGYVERRYTVNADGTWISEDIERKEGTFHKVKATDIHQIIALPNGTCETIMIPGEGNRISCFWNFGESIAKVKQWNQRKFKTYEKV